MTIQTPQEFFPATPRNRVKRLHERGSYDRDAVCMPCSTAPSSAMSPM